ncbi:ABC transporter ATP-binding protein [Taibaiella lutea]|uniref:ABC transporter ATP-binding protein n=1 Tax=Taibaiella lutea TaxID=2608001 RepID=A0A5M6CEF6_9BACT|nr:ABC transporter ATP-binding protein [Taibaiella lutea]KAA5533363.1 ABC transporter ATP-binding protein [Taibaiella lutea]
MNYDLNIEQKSSTGAALRKMLQFMSSEKKELYLAFFVMLLNAGITMLVPYVIGYTIDHYIKNSDYKMLMTFSGFLFVLYIIWAGTEYLQTKLMGGVGQRMLYALRNQVFEKLQQFPVAFFNQNKSGDLISRINNDTDKVNQFFSQSLMQFVDSIFTMLGAAAFLLAINIELGAASLVPGVCILIFVQLVSGWVKKKNAGSMKSTGGMSAEIQESLQNFRTIITFNRRDYFRKRFDEVNEENYKAAIGAGLANNIFTPVFTLFSNIAQLIVLAFGIYLITKGQFTVGLLISFIAYVQNFYFPLRQLAALWASFQTAMAAWDRIAVILSLEAPAEKVRELNVKSLNFGQSPLLEFSNVSFAYPNGKQVLNDINFKMEQGKTYALVGPTGGGKTTTAMLIARLYDPTEGMVLLHGKDIKQFEASERTHEIGFILQEPLLFTGTVKDNILYGNEKYKDFDEEKLMEVLQHEGLNQLVQRFDDGLKTKVQANGESISLGQKQLIAFIRAVLRKPSLLILDEATANIDTVTEQLLEDILKKLPQETTKVIIAHRLNTIENADEIFFVNSGSLQTAGSLKNAMSMLLEGKRAS